MSNNQQSAVDLMRAITISREYGSGGGEIARRLCARLLQYPQTDRRMSKNFVSLPTLPDMRNITRSITKMSSDFAPEWQLIDHEVIVRVANALGVSESEVEEQDEYAQSTVGRILSNLRSVDPAIMVYPLDNNLVTNEESYHNALINVVQAAAQTGHVVIVGRGSQKILADRRDVLHVRIVAPLAARVAYVVQREGLDSEAARDRILQKDRQRERYLNTHYHESSSDASLYDICVNTGIISLDDAVSLICSALAKKAARLNTPEEQLGPGAGSTPYPGMPHDFRSHMQE